MTHNFSKVVIWPGDIVIVTVIKQNQLRPIGSTFTGEIEKDYPIAIGGYIRIDGIFHSNKITLVIESIFSFVVHTEQDGMYLIEKLGSKRLGL